MRARVFRNLDRPFRVLGFSPVELTILCLGFVLGGEILSSAGASRIWAFLSTALNAVGLYLFRRTFGDQFGMRLIRFLTLPGQLQAKLIRRGGSR